MVCVILLILKIHVSFSDCLQTLLVPQILISTVLLLSFLHLRLQIFSTFGSLATGRSLHICFQIHLFPARLASCHPYPAALHNCGPGLQISQAHLASLLCQKASQLQWLQPQEGYEKLPSKVMGCWKLCYNPKQSILLLSCPTHYSCQGQGFSGSSQNTQIIDSCHESRLETCLHLKKVKGEGQGRGEGSFAQDFVWKGNL